MSAKKPSEAWEKLLLDMEYREFRHPDHKPERRCFQRCFRAPSKPDYEVRKRFVNVYCWDLRHLNPNIKELSFEVESSFETQMSGIWSEVKLYSIDPQQLLELLPTFHARMDEVFRLFEGVYKD